MPPFILESAFVIRIFLVSAFFPEVTQQIHSLRAKGVISSHIPFTTGKDAIALRKSAGSVCGTDDDCLVADIRFYSLLFAIIARIVLLITTGSL